MVKKYFFLSILILFAGSIKAEVILSGNIDNQMLTGAGKLSEILPDDVEYVLLIGNDGTAALISQAALSLITLTDDNCVTESLPRVCNIDNLVEICVYRSFHSDRFSKTMKNFELLGISKRNGYFARKYKRIPK